MTLLNPLDLPRGHYPNVQPFSPRAASGYQDELESMRVYIQRKLTPYLQQTEQAHIDDANLFAEELASLAARTFVVGPFKNAITGWYHVSGFGAVADNTTDQREKIQNTIDAAPAGAVIHVDGTDGDTYLVSGTAAYSYALLLADGKELRGSGATIRAMPTLDGVEIVRVTGNGSKVHGLGWHVSNIINATCIRAADGISDLEVFNNKFKDAGSGGVYALANVTDVNVHDNEALGGKYAVLVNDGAGNARWNVHHNHFHDGVGGDAIAFNGSNNFSTDMSADHNRIENWRGSPTSSSVGHGVSLAYVINGSADGNFIRGTDRNGVHVEALSRHISVALNHIFDTQNGGIEVQGEGKPCSYVSVIGNHVHNCAIATSTYQGHLSNGGIDIGGANDQMVTGGGAYFITIENNHVSGCRGSGMWLQYLAYSVVKNNVVTNTYGQSNDTAVVNNTGYEIIGSKGLRFSDNQAIDTRGVGIDGGSATQFYPLAFRGTQINSTFLNNVRDGNLSTSNNDNNPPVGVS